MDNNYVPWFAIYYIDYLWQAVTVMLPVFTIQQACGDMSTIESLFAPVYERLKKTMFIKVFMMVMKMYENTACYMIGL